MCYTIEQIAEIIEAKHKLPLDRHNEILYLQTDSRKIFQPEQSIFIALKGERHNGHDYIEDVYQKGIKHFILSEQPPKIYQDANYLFVTNTLESLHKLATFHRKKNKLQVIAITGSNGKTIVKEWLYQLLKEDYKICKNPKSYNSQIGVPLSVWNISPSDDYGIFEAGISQPGEMSKLEKILLPEIGIFTNIGGAHAENFTDNLQKIEEKLKLFVNAKILIYCEDYRDIDRLVKKHLKNITGFTWSYQNKQSSLFIQSVTKTNNHSVITVVFNQNEFSFEIPFTDDASIENSIQCLSFLLLNNYAKETIIKRMYNLSTVEMRLEQKDAINGCTLINDSYNSDIDSLKIALDYVSNQNKYKKTTLILSDILQSGKNETVLYQNVSTLIKEKNITRLIGIGNAINRHKDVFSNGLFYRSTEDFLRTFNFSGLQNELILLKGARTFNFEKIAEKIQQKTHETVLEINLNAVVHNLNYYKSKLLPKTKLMVMVKAFGYGSGGAELANVLQFHKVDYLGVAYADEGIELRKSGISLPIMVMNPETEAYDSMIDYNLEPEIYSFRVLDLFLSKLEKISLGIKYPIHLKIDTGMHRLGFVENEIDKLITKILSATQLKVESIFSHLAAADDCNKDDFTRKQINLFKTLSEKIEKALNYKVCKHLLNSSGIIRFPEAQFNMVRLGIGLHGISNINEEKKYLQPVATLKTTISQLKKLYTGDNVGYGANTIVPNEKLIAIVPVGYADGYNRALSNGKGYMLIRGQKAPTIGNICMDMCMLDVTHISGVKEGDEVQVFGEKLPVSILADSLNTIPYEILSSVSHRVKRVYYQE
jgi:alanine racemase